MKSYVKSLFVLVLITVGFQALAQSDPTGDIKTALTNPWVLYGLMLVGSLVSMLKQWGVSKMDEGPSPGIGAYLMHWQETVTTLFGNTVAFLLLIDSGNLNFVSAISIGYAINSLSDVNPMGSRSTSLK